jgi:hypothetical protein
MGRVSIVDCVSLINGFEGPTLYDAGAMRHAWPGRLIPAILPWIVCATATFSAAQTPAKPGVALVVEVAGGRVAGLEPYREIPDGATVTVPPGVRFVFQHYGSCRRFTMVGGVATFRADGVDIAGTRASDTRVACPRKITLKADGAAGGVLMRSIGAPRTAISSRPEFVVVGPRAAEFATLRVRRGDEIVIEQSLAGGPAVRWPSHVPPLAAATNYELELLPRSGDRAIVIGLRTLEAPAAGETMTLVSAE